MISTAKKRCACRLMCVQAVAALQPASLGPMGESLKQQAGRAIN
ncbi:hypothetical protein EPYR_01762 [Erwinia pyrifoliae DSM 12163]|nr:hypothetical protein EPYR_01762 [Erwinia pyrifoliae DSM 12163]